MRGALTVQTCCCLKQQTRDILKVLMPIPSDATRKEIEDILDTQMRSFRYHAAQPGALEQVGVQGGGSVWMPRKGQLPKPAPALPVAEAASAKSMQILREKGAVRGVIYKTAG